MSEHLANGRVFKFIQPETPRIKINRINKLILSIFKEKRWITKFEIDENDSDFYRAYGRKILGR